MTRSPGIRSALLFAAAIGPLFAAPPVHAQQASAYWTDSSSNVWRNAYGECWRAGYWTPALATAACDPDLLPKPVAAAPPPPPVAKAPPPAPAPAPTPRKVVPTMDKFTTSADTLFDFDKSALKPEGRATLDNLVEKLKPVDVEVIIAVGHTDSIGTHAYNQKLSERRAAAVKDYLVGRGIDAGRIQASGKGETQPVAANRVNGRDNPQGRAQNRRVEIEVIGTRAR